MANLDVIEFECPRCLNRIRVANEKAGQRIDCPSCQGSLLVPKQPSEQGLFEDIFDSSSSQQESPRPADPREHDSSKNDEAPSIGPPGDEPDKDHGAESDDDIVGGISQQESASSSDGANPLDVNDPFEVDKNAPLKIDGMGDLFGHADVYGFKCEICDTRIHVRPDQADTYVECPECYSRILVKPPGKNPKPAQRWVKEGRDKKPKTAPNDDDLKLSEPIDRPKLEIDTSFGLDAPSEDLLAPKQKMIPAAGEEDGLETNADKPSQATASKPNNPKAKQPVQPQRKLPKSGNQLARAAASVQGKSRRELYEESQRREQTKEATGAHRIDDSSDRQDTDGFPDVEFGSLFAAAMLMLRSRGVTWRVLFSVTSMCFGLIVMESIYPSATSTSTDGQTGSMAEQLVKIAAWSIFGDAPYLLGALMLWMTSAHIFRDAALGRRTVESWKYAGTAELTGTFLIFSFGFFIGGLPALFLIWFVLPLRMLLAPLFLLGAWYGRGPFAIVNVDAFQNFSEEISLWGAFYKFMAVLAAFGFVGGLMFWMRGFEVIPFEVNVLLSVAAVLISTAVTLIFAAVCGWHCGRVVEGLENTG